ncbi:MAG: DUF87 domain-containing protein [Lachnospiraceae bacterium]|nr:DUF87 domain-containing protein [Lachnospiraceae bacterium]
MIKEMTENQDMIKVKIPKSSLDVIPVEKVYDNGMFFLGHNRYSMCYRLIDIDYSDKKEDAQEQILQRWSDILASFSGMGATFKITICNRKINTKEEMEKTFIQTDIGDGYDYLRVAYNELRYDDIKGDKGVVREKYITISVFKKNEREANAFFDNQAYALNKRLLDISSGILIIDVDERLAIFHDFIRAGHEEEFNFVYNKDNARHFKRYIAPESITFHSSYFECNDKKGSAFILRTWSDYIEDEFFNNLADITTNLMVTLDIIPFSLADTRKFVDDRESNVEGSAYAWANRPLASKGNNIIRLPKKLVNQRAAIDQWNEDINKRNQKLFFNQVTVCILADDEEKLTEYSESIINTATEKGASLGKLYNQQLQGLQNTLPFGVRTISSLRDCNTETTAVMIPFSSIQLKHETGIPYGRHILTRQQQLLDRRLQANGHEFIFGSTGYGKSMGTKKKMFFEALLTDGDIVVLDPDGEYTPLIRALGGTVIEVGNDSINAMELPADYDTNEPFKKKSNFIISFIEAIIGRENYDEKKKSITDRCVKEVLTLDIQNFYVDEKDNIRRATLVDWYNCLLAQPEAEAKALALQVERHIVGTGDIFARPSSVDRSGRIVCYNLSTLPKQLKDAGMNLCLDDIDQRLIRNRHLNKTTYITLDEMDYYFKHESSTIIIEDFFERSRKYGGRIRGIIQSIDKVLDNDIARNMFTLCDNIVMMHQEDINARRFQQMYGLSDNQYKFLLAAEPGCGINKLGNIIYSFDDRIPENNAIYEFINTDR